MVVAGDLYLVTRFPYIVMPLGERFNNSKHLKVYHPLVCLINVEFARVEGYGVPMALSWVPLDRCDRITAIPIVGALHSTRRRSSVSKSATPEHLQGLTQRMEGLSCLVRQYERG